MEIKSKEDWWTSLDNNWPNIVAIFSNCGAPLDGNMWSDGIGKEVTYHSEIFIVMIERLKKERNGSELHHWLNLCWFAAPDSEYIHHWPSWSAFCDLCSEDWVFEEEVIDAS